jgi:hypothetical protein
MQKSNLIAENPKAERTAIACACSVRPTASPPSRMEPASSAVATLGHRLGDRGLDAVDQARSRGAGVR